MRRSGGNPLHRTAETEITNNNEGDEVQSDLLRELPDWRSEKKLVDDRSPLEPRRNPGA